MQTLFITGNHLRHIFLVKKFTKYFRNFSWIMEKRDININHNKLTKNQIYLKHISDFKKQEILFFGKSKNFTKQKKNRPIIVSRKKTNSYVFNQLILKEIDRTEPKVIFSYGCRKIDVNTFKNKKIKSFNIHGGLLPKYRGVNTNFWPHIYNDSNQIGITMHNLSDKIDSGNIFFQESVSIKKKDTINTLSCKAIEKFCNTKTKKIFLFLSKNNKSKGIRFKTSFKVWKKKDFKPKYIKIAYKKFEEYKKNNIKDTNIKLINIF